MAVDVSSEIVIQRPREVVASYAADPDNAPTWYENIKSVEWKSPRPLRSGTRVAFIAMFLGRPLAYTYEVREFVAGELLIMSTREGPFPMETTYRWESTLEGGTHMILRNRGQPAGFSRLVSPFMEFAVRRANRKDLLRLKRLLEQPARS